jgi:chromosome segregation ATPase
MFGMAKSKATVSHEEIRVPEMEFADFEDELEDVLEDNVTEELPGDWERASDLEPAEEDVTGTVPAEPKHTSITQASLAALAAFEGEMRASAAGLEVLDTTLAAIGAAHETANRLLGSLRSGVLRANDFEEANAAFSSENRRLSEQLEQAKHAQSQLESAEEASKRRIELLIKDYDEVKIALGRSQIEAVELRDALAQADSEKTTLIYELATKTTTVDRYARENELLRQKCVNQQISLAAVEQRYCELEMKLNETAAIRKAEAVEMADLRMRHDNTEKECRRLQKQSELSQVRLAEGQERIMTLEADLEELQNRHAATNERFRAEAEVMKAKLETAVRKSIAEAGEVAALKQQLGSAVAATGVAEAQLACANGQIASRQPKDGREGGPRTSSVIGITSYGRERQEKKIKALAEPGRLNGGGVRPGRSRQKAVAAGSK